MAELDFALLADYAAVVDGKLTIVGGSYTHVWSPEHDDSHQTYVAGRIRTSEPTVELGISVAGPNRSYELATTAALSSNMVAYDGRHRTLIFAVRLDIPIVGPGLYEVNLRVDQEPVRRLEFSIEVPSHAGG